MNQGPYELLGDPNTPRYVKDFIKELLEDSDINSVFWPNVVLMAFCKRRDESIYNQALVEQTTERKTV